MKSAAEHQQFVQRLRWRITYPSRISIFERTMMEFLGQPWVMILMGLLLLGLIILVPVMLIIVIVKMTKK
jgi:hypothetical protein